MYLRKHTNPTQITTQQTATPALATAISAAISPDNKYNKLTIIV
jgi:hypothetical protein